MKFMRLAEPEVGGGWQVPQKLYEQMDRFDRMPAELRLCVHEFGLPIVTAFVNAGVTKPNVIRHLVTECWQGPRHCQQRKRRHTVLNHLDWILQKAEAKISAETLLRVLASNAMVIVPLDPTPQMVEASMATVSSFDVMVTKHQKHKRRLKAAIARGVAHLWPHLTKGAQ